MLGVFGSLARAVVAPIRARRRGLTLLRENLNAEQLREYDQHQSFRVQGGETGRWYRIRQGWSMNIDELDTSGDVLTTWCFYPGGSPCTPDVMLAQKVALETFEGDALAIANYVRVSYVRRRRNAPALAK